MRKILFTLLLFLLLYLFTPMVWWSGRLRPPLASPRVREEKKPWEYGPFSRPSQFSDSVKGIDGQLALALKAVRERNPDVRKAIAEKVTEPRARLFLSRLESADESF